MLNGKKSYLGAMLYAAGAALVFLGYAEIGELVKQLGGSLATVGIAHKIAKAA